MQPSVEKNLQKKKKKLLSETAIFINSERLFINSSVYETRPIISGNTTAIIFSNQLPAIIILTNEQFEALIDKTINRAR